MKKMKLRKLNISDAPLMLEWMHDEDVVKWMQANFKEMTIDDCKEFICQSDSSDDNLHRAIVDENDIYMGTVSLKHIDRDKQLAEFAITIRKCAMGKGFSQFGMNEIMKIGFKKLRLNKIIWCVSKENIRAIKFYQKMNYSTLEEIPIQMKHIYHNWKEMKWFYCNNKYSEK